MYISHLSQPQPQALVSCMGPLLVGLSNGRFWLKSKLKLMEEQKNIYSKIETKSKLSQNQKTELTKIETISFN